MSVVGVVIGVTVEMIGAVVSGELIVKESTVVELGFPALSMRVTLTELAQAESALLGVQVTEVDTAGDGVHVHPVIVAVSPIDVTMITSGVASRVVYGSAESPSTEVIVGADGAVVSMVRLGVSGEIEEFHARSVTVIVNDVVPSPRALSGLQVTVVVVAGVGVHVQPVRVTESSIAVTTINSGVVSLVINGSDVSPPIDVMERPVGAVVSTVRLGVVAVLTFPARSVIVTLGVVVPSARGVSGVQVTLAPTAGVGVHVQPVRATVSPTVVTTIMSGVVSEVKYESVVSPPIEVIAGAVGAVVSV